MNQESKLKDSAYFNQLHNNVCDLVKKQLSAPAIFQEQMLELIALNILTELEIAGQNLSDHEFVAEQVNKYIGAVLNFKG